jgi:hypothetical protein
MIGLLRSDRGRWRNHGMVSMSDEGASERSTLVLLLANRSITEWSPGTTHSRAPLYVISNPAADDFLSKERDQRDESSESAHLSKTT